MYVFNVPMLSTEKNDKKVTCKNHVCFLPARVARSENLHRIAYLINRNLHFNSIKCSIF